MTDPRLSLEGKGQGNHDLRLRDEGSDAREVMASPGHRGRRAHTYRIHSQLGSPGHLTWPDQWGPSGSREQGQRPG